MILRDDLVRFLDHTLNLAAIPHDHANNGLQVEGRAEVRRVVGSVDACQALYDEAARLDADFIFVHHGESWGPGFQRIVGPLARRMATLHRAGMSLYAVHLPLDAHPTLGHNACLAAMLQLQEPQPFAVFDGAAIGYYGALPEPLAPAALAARVDELLGTSCRVYPFGGDRAIRRLGIVSGGAVKALDEAAQYGLDALLTGEVRHQDYHYMRELGRTVIVGGHYHTERPGIHAVLALLQAQFALDCHFVPLPTGM